MASRCLTLRLTVVATFTAVIGLSAAPSFASADEVYDNFVCPDRYGVTMDFHEDKELQEKSCTLKASIPEDFVWGPVCGRLWAGDIGYWVEQSYYNCGPTGREVIRGRLTYCTALLAYQNITYVVPNHRMIPVCPVNDGKTRDIVYGFKVRRQSDPTACATEIRGQGVICDTPKSPRKPLPVEDLARSMLHLDGGNILMTVASYDYARLAVAWHAYVTKTLGYKAAIVIAMDENTWSFLDNRGVPSAVVENIAVHGPCCLNRFKMLLWRAANNIKVRGLLGALRAGATVTMADMDVNLIHAPKFTDGFMNDYQLGRVYYSFMWSVSTPSPGIISMWEHVLEEVLTGGWDQSQYNYYAETMEADGIINSTAVTPASIIRAQNQEYSVESGFISSVQGWQHPDYKRRTAIMWDPYSPCASDEKGLEQGWKLLEPCAKAIVLAADKLNRAAIFNLAPFYDMGTLRDWFEVMDVSSAKANGMFSKDISHYKSEVVDVASLSSHSGMKIPQESELVYLIGTPAVLIQHLEKEADEQILHILDNYLAPTAPSRLSLPCMRGGGPESDTNRDRCKKPAPPDWRPPAPPQTE